MHESPEAAFRQLKLRGGPRRRQVVADHLRHAMIRPVFTAHPSEARRRTILGEFAAISQHLDRMETSQLTVSERDRAVDEIAEECRDTLVLRHDPPIEADGPG